MDNSKDVTEIMIIPLSLYQELIETRVRYNVITEHIRCVLTGKNKYYESSLFRAVLGLPEEEEGDANA